MQRSRRQQDRQIVHQRMRIFEENYHCYGSPRLVKALKIHGFGCGKARIRRLMKQEGINPKQKRRFRPRTTQSHPYAPYAPNVIMAMPPASSPAERFHSDITYIPTREGFLYLAATIDAFTRWCTGWCARVDMETQLVKDAALMAFETKAESGCIHHSDRGSQYTSETFRLLLEGESIQSSMSRKANCYDNALIESF